MRALHIFIVAVVFGLCTGCTSGGDGLDFTTTWNLVNVSGGFAGVDHTFQRGLIKWTFYEEDGIIKVTNNNDIDSLNDIFETGTYPYTIEEIGTDYHIFIEGEDFGVIAKTSTIMTINQEQINDGFLITLIR